MMDGEIEDDEHVGPDAKVGPLYHPLDYGWSLERIEKGKFQNSQIYLKCCYTMNIDINQIENEQCNEFYNDR